MDAKLVKSALLAQANAHSSAAYQQGYTSAVTPAVAREFGGQLPDSYEAMRERIERIVYRAVNDAISEAITATELRKEAEALGE